VIPPQGIFLTVPSNIRLTNEKLPLEHLRHWYLDPDFASLAPELEKLFRTLDIACTPSAENEADFVLKKGADPVPEGREAYFRGEILEAGRHEFELA